MMCNTDDKKLSATFVKYNALTLANFDIYFFNCTQSVSICFLITVHKTSKPCSRLLVNDVGEGD